VAPRDPFFTTHPRPHSTPEASRTVAGGPSEASDRRLNVRGGCPTPAGVAERIHAAWYLIRDPAGVEKSARSQFRRSLAPLGPPATVRDASGVDAAATTSSPAPFPSTRSPSRRSSR